MSDIIDFPTQAKGPFCPKIHGPFEPEHYVSLDGYKVPHVTVHPQPDGKVGVTIDNRFTTHEPVSEEEFARWIWLLANAMAVAAGYTAHGEHCRPMKDLEYKTRMGELGSVDS